MPRLSYLPFLLARLHAFFLPSLIDTESIPYDGWFTFENVPLKWQYPLGLLHDLFSGASPDHVLSQELNDESAEDEDLTQLPWRLTVHFSEWPEKSLVRPDADGKVLHDAFINAVKEADFLRNGTAKGIMSLSKEDSTALWNAVQERERSDSPSRALVKVDVGPLQMTSALSTPYPRGSSTPKVPHYAIFH